MEYYLRELRNIGDIISELKSKVIKSYFTGNKNEQLSLSMREDYCFTPVYQQYYKILSGVVDISDMLGIEYLWEHKEILKHHMILLVTPSHVKFKSKIENSLDLVTRIFDKERDQILEKLKLLSEEEIDRLNEAVNCYIETCNYSAIIMAVSSIECRLLKIMQVAKPDPKLDRLTLGDLIREYMDNKDQYKRIIPRKHEPLLDLCNQYRVFSVHPKKEQITRPIATSIVNMTFAFLLDEDLKTN